MNRLVAIASGIVIASLGAAVAAVGGTRAASLSAPFVYDVHSDTSGGYMSNLWGDGGVDPKGFHLGCIPGRHYALAIVVHNQTEQSVWIRAVGGDQPHARVIRRVAVQARPRPPAGMLAHTGIRPWSGTPGAPLAVPAAGDAWLQVNFAMGQCGLIKQHTRLVVRDSLRISFADSSGAVGAETVGPIVPVILTRASSDAIKRYRHRPAGY